MLRARPPSLLPVLCALTAFWACGPGKPVVGKDGSAWIIGVEEIRESGAEDVLELIRDARPAWLIRSPLRDPSDPTERSGLLVLVNDVPPQPLHTLQFMPLEGIREIRYLTPTFAETHYRVRSSAGVILVLRPPPTGGGRDTEPDTTHPGEPG